MSLFVGSCKDCGREMVLQRVWPLRPDLHEGRARAGGFDMCNGCYGRARRAGTLPDPAPRERRVEIPDVSVAYEVACAVCGHLGTPSRRDVADHLRTQHIDAHRAQAEASPRPRRTRLTDVDVARLRQLVGVGTPIQGGDR